MPDREKVIKGLECCMSEHICRGCPYREKGECEDGGYYYSKAIEDAIALLREQEAMHWVSVKNRLPTYAELKDDRVLVLLDDGGICSTGFDECIENESVFGEWRQNFDPVTLGATDSYWMPLEGVTHWMPIPKLPWEGR